MIQGSGTAGRPGTRSGTKRADETGTDPLLTSTNSFQRINPVVGATYKFTPGLTGYAGYSEANRAPTPLELGCSDPVHPCMIDNFLISDPCAGLGYLLMRALEKLLQHAQLVHHLKR